MIRFGPLLAALSVASFGALVWYSVMVLKPSAGGLLPFDERVLGYTFDDAKAYLTALSNGGRAVYLVEVRILDTVFPIFLALYLGYLAMHLAGDWMHPWSRMILVLPAAGYVLMDLCENALVAEILRAGPQGITTDMVALASEFTVTKWFLVLVSFGVPAVLWLLRRRAKQT